SQQRQGLRCRLRQNPSRTRNLTPAHPRTRKREMGHPGSLRSLSKLGALFLPKRQDGGRQVSRPEAPLARPSSKTKGNRRHPGRSSSQAPSAHVRTSSALQRARGFRTIPKKTPRSARALGLERTPPCL